MKLLQGIQSSLLEDQIDLSTVLLKLQVLASRLESKPLDDWVKHETEGYPMDMNVPSYRIVPTSHTGTFRAPSGSGITDAPIPPSLIAKYAGKSWTHREIRESIAVVNGWARPDQNGDGLRLDASDLILLLQGKIYKGYSCNSVVGYISQASLTQIEYMVRKRILGFTLALEKSIPQVARVDIGGTAAFDTVVSDDVTQIFNQTIYGNVMNISNEAGASTVVVVAGDTDALRKALVRSGIEPSDAAAFAKIVASEGPGTPTNPFGKNAKTWLKANFPKALEGAWKASSSTVAKTITEAVLAFSGFK